MKNKKLKLKKKSNNIKYKIRNFRKELFIELLFFKS